MKILDIQILSDRIKKCKSALSKSDSFWDNSYCVKLVKVLLAGNAGRRQFIVSEDTTHVLGNSYDLNNL